LHSNQLPLARSPRAPNSGFGGASAPKNAHPPPRMQAFPPGRKPPGLRQRSNARPAYRSAIPSP
jgi:hypothetical protein